MRMKIKPVLRTAAMMGRELTGSERLENLWWHQTHCFECEAEVEWDAAVCETCGQELLEHGKN